MKPSPKAWMAAGIVLSFVCAAGLVAIAQEVAQHIPDDAEYATSKLCSMCHKEEAAAFAETPHAKHVPPGDAEEPWKHNTGWNKETGEAAEAGIQCEACHGRGSTHVKAKAEERADLIVNPLNIEDNNIRVSICAQCHARYTAKEGDLPVAFTPGENLLEKVDLLPAEAGALMQQVNEMVTSKHFTEKQMGCIQCHTSHAEDMTEGNLRLPLPDLCVQCHHEEADLAAHTEGKAQEGDTCATCHMPDGVHTFAKASKDA